MKKFKEFLVESVNITSQDIDEMKTLTKWMDDRDKKKYLGALDKFFAAYNAKEIYNAQFGQTYSYDLVRPLENAKDKMRNTYMEKMRENQFADDSDGYGFYVNSIKKELRHWVNFKDKYPEYYNFFYALRNLPDFIKELKTYVKKGREPKPVDPNAYVKPMVPYEAKKKALEFLDAAVNAIRNEYYRSMEESFQKIKKEVVAKATEFEFRWSKYFSDKHNKMSQDNKIVSSLIFDQVGSGPRDANFYQKMELKKNADDILRNLARRQVDDIINQFLAKNSEKLGHIFAKKVSITEHKIIYNRVHQRNLENSMFFKFDDNSQFKIYTSTVYGYSKNGVLFVKFPTRFTDVIHKNGEKMGMPSEKKMIEDF